MRNSRDYENLEAMIDEWGLKTTLESIAGICHEKAEHIQASYAESSSDDPTAKRWERAANVVDTASGRKSVLQVS